MSEARLLLGPYGHAWRDRCEGRPGCSSACVPDGHDVLCIGWRPVGAEPARVAGRGFTWHEALQQAQRLVKRV